ncbi:MAG: alpha/beta hydrolase [Candidatus Obscuribacterales bacterium]|nr:alpha/beta hydrolase [Candidatus Obscuribacterales bacterium]
MKIIALLLLVGTAITVAGLLYFYYWLCPKFADERVKLVLFHPQKASNIDSALLTLQGIKAKEVEFESFNSNDRLHGIFYKKPDSEFIVLFSHGNGGNLNCCSTFFEAVLKSGVSLFAYDYRGYGMSEGEPSVPGIVNDAKAAYDYVNKRLDFDGSKIILYGSSLGGGVTTQLAMARKCKAIMLDSTFVSPEILAKERFSLMRIYPSSLWFEPNLDNLKYVRHNQTPILIMTAKTDNVIPSSHSQRLYKSAVGQKSLRVFKNSKHADFSKDFDIYSNAIIDFIAKQTSKNCLTASVSH